MISSPNLTYLAFADYGLALSALNSLPANHDLLEFGQQQCGNYIMLVNSPHNILTELKVPTVDSVYIEKVHADLLAGYFKMKKTQANSNLLVLESVKLGDLFFAVNGLLRNTDFQLIEIQRNPLVGGKALALLANGSKPHASYLRDSITSRLMEHLSDTIKKLFNI